TNGVPHGLRFSIVNMDANGGLGAIIQGAKNLPIQFDVSEKLAATRHANGKDYWIITHGLANNKFYATLFTSNGPVQQVVSSIGASYDTLTYDPIGQLKISGDGSKITCSTYDQKLIELFQFDNITGKISSPITITGYHKNYGCEFSADGTKLYVSRLDSATLYQFDLTIYDSSS